LDSNQLPTVPKTVALRLGYTPTYLIFISFHFSTEHNSKNDFSLEKTGRYSHSKKYIDDLSKKFDFQISSFKKINLRKQSDHYLIGEIYFLDF
jgi:predicted TPR repeat methyltransferase